MEKIFEQIIEEHQLSIQESKVQYDTQTFWESAIIDSDQYPISGGFSNNKMNARKIALAELVERLKFKENSQSKELMKKWGHNKINTACGYAAGFNKNKTILRSISEAAERWVMSLWIDEQYYIPQININKIHSQLSEASKYFLDQFDEVLFFSKKIIVFLNKKPLEINVAQTMGIKGNGIYPGSSAQILSDDIWEHALLESHRHYLFVKNTPKIKAHKFPENKVYFFSENSKIALDQINKAKNTNWPQPKISHFYDESIYNKKMFIARTIFDGWKSWQQGDLKRFLY